MKTLCHPDKPHVAKRLCRDCYNAQYNRRKRLDAATTYITTAIHLAAEERSRKHDPLKYKRMGA